MQRFIDYKKAFDKVNHSKLIQVLRKYDVPAEEISDFFYWQREVTNIKRFFYSIRRKNIRL